MQILPAIDMRGGKCVRLKQGDYEQETVFGDDPVAMAERWASQGAERLHLVDLDGAKEGRPVNHEVVRGIVAAVGVPCQFGGGLRTKDSLELMLDDVGVDRAIVGTAALKDPDWFREMVARFPGRIALGLDARDSKVAVSGWLDVSSVNAIDLAETFRNLELAAVIYTNIANDGMMQGVDDATIADMLALAELGFPVIASGGVTSLEDIKRLAAAHRAQPNLVGAIIGRAIYEGAIKVDEAVAAARS